MSDGASMLALMKIDTESQGGTMAAVWTFKPGTREGFTASPITIFQGARLQATVRETIQNSLDAGKTQPVKVCFSMAEIPLANLPELSSLREIVQLAADEEVNFTGKDGDQASEAMNFYKNALDVVLASPTTHIFGIHDFNTSGLGGALREKPGVKPGQWLALVKGAGVDVKDDAASLGSFGQGAKAPFAYSQLRSLFYLSQVHATNSEDLEDRFQGKSLLSSFWQDDATGTPALRIGTGFYGLGEDQDALVGDEVPVWAKTERAKFGSAAGTSILLPAPHGFAPDSVDDFWKLLKISVITNFYYALVFKKLVVLLDDGTVLDDSTCKDVAQQLGLLDDEIHEDLDPDTQDKVEALKTVVMADHFGVKQSKEFGDFYWAMRVGERAPSKKVGIARKTGMLITRRPPEFLKFPGMGNFDIFICVTADEGSKVLRALENPAHDAFEYDRVGDPAKLEQIKRKYKVFASEVREIIREHATLSGDEEESTDDLNDLLGGSLDDGADTSLRVEFPEKSRIREGVKPLRLITEAGPGTSGNSGAGGGTGAGGGNSTGGSGGGDGTGEGNSGKKTRLVSGLMLVPGAGVDSFRIYFTQKREGSSELFVYSSGDTSRELLEMELGGEKVVAINSDKWMKASTGKDRYFVDVTIPSFKGAIEALIQDDI